jgi:hypothetical protein
MSKSLPLRPSLEQLKKQAKDLLKSQQTGDPNAHKRIRENHPDWRQRPLEKLHAARFALADAQLVIAREYGCASWPKLKAQVASILASPATGITWNSIYYKYRASADGKRKWLWAPVRRGRTAYQPPGLYRNTQLDAQGQIGKVTINDSVRGQRLEYWPDQKKAHFTEIARMSSETFSHDPHGPFGPIIWEMEKENPPRVETRQTAAGPVDVFRLFDKEHNSSRDVWIDQRTKRLVEVHYPGRDAFDPETDPPCENPPDKAWSDKDWTAAVNYGIAFDVVLDDALFRLEPPEGYVVERAAPFTEQDVIDYLNIAAEYNQKTFPDRIEFKWGDHQSVQTWFATTSTVILQKFSETQQRFLNYGPGAPVNPFIKDSTEENTFRYLGKGIKLGDKDRAICWYQPKGASQYRVIYGDLTVKDVPAEALPLPAES